MKTVIAGLEEGLQSIAEALEGGGGGGIVPTPTAKDEGKVLTAGDDGTASWETPSGGGGIPTPTLDDEGKVLRAVPQSQTRVAPEWGTIRELPAGGRAGQVLTKSYEGYEWENSNGVPALYDEDNSKVLMAQYDPDTENTYPAWSLINQVPESGIAGQVLTKTERSYEWATPSGGGGGHMDVVKFDIDKAQFNKDASMYKAYANTEDPNIAAKINNIISISIVDNVDEGYPDVITPTSNDDCAIFYEDDLVTVKISSAIYGKLGTRQDSHFYMTYYKA